MTGPKTATTHGVTGRGFISKINDPSDSEPDISGPKTCIPTPGVGKFFRAIGATALVVALGIASISALVAVAVYSPRCKPGDKAIYIGGMFMGGCQERR